MMGSSPPGGRVQQLNGMSPSRQTPVFKGVSTDSAVGNNVGHMTNSNSSTSQSSGNGAASAKQQRGGGPCGAVWSCVFCVADTVRWIPVLFISSVVLWSYYAYTVELCFYAIDNVLQRVLYLVCYHIVFIMFVWSYAFTIFHNPGTPQRRFTLSLQQLDQYTSAQNDHEERLVLQQIAHTLPVLCRQMNGGVRYCKPCTAIKPDRCHHCSICRRCVLKMDHHCPWVNNCIGFANYKFFVLFLFYATLYCFYVSVSDMPYFISYWKLNEHKELSLSHRMQVIFLGLVASMFIIGVMSLLSYHIFLLFNNKTTIETFRLPIFVTGEDKRGFGIGWRKNFIQVFGADPKLWAFPIFSSLGNGNSFPCAQQEPESNTLLGEEFEEGMDGCVVHSGSLGCPDIMSSVPHPNKGDPNKEEDNCAIPTDMMRNMGVHLQDYQHTTDLQGIAMELSEKNSVGGTIDLFSVSEEEDNDYSVSKAV